MSLETPPELLRLRRAFALEGPEAGSCPSADRIFDAAHGGLTKMSEKEQGELLDHVASCPVCSQSWRLALEIAREVAPGAATAEAEANATEGVPGANVVALSSRPAVPPWRRALPILSGIAALLLGALALPMLLPGRHGGPDPGMRGAETLSIADASGPLDRTRCVLRWRLEPAQAGALFTVRAMSESLEVLADQSTLEATELLIAPEKLSAIPPGGKLLWQVQASLPDGSVKDSPTFSSPLP